MLHKKYSGVNKNKLTLDKKSVSCQHQKVDVAQKSILCRQKQDDAAHKKNILCSKQLLFFFGTMRYIKSCGKKIIVLKCCSFNERKKSVS